MSIRTVIRIVALSVGLVLASPLAGHAAGPPVLSGAEGLLLLGGLALLGLSFGYLMLLAGGGDLTRWQLRYHLPSSAGHEESGRLEHVLHFLADRTGHFVLEASATGLVLEIPEAFDRYVEAQLPRTLPEVKLSKPDENGEGPSAGSFFLCTGSPNSGLLRWATEHRGRQVRLHIHQGPLTTLIAQTDGSRPPGRWVRLPLTRLLRRLWYRLPLWDGLSLGIQLSSLFPPTDDVTVYSSRSRLHQLIPPDDYAPDPAADGGCRTLGQSTDGRPLTLSYDVPLFTVGAPAAFLAQQVLADLEAGWPVVVVSPHRNMLARIAHQAAGIPTHWLDPQNSHRSAHLALVTAAEAVAAKPPLGLPVPGHRTGRSAEEWETHAFRIETIVEAAQTFLVGLGVDIHLPAVGAFCQHLIRALASSAQHAGRDLSFTDLYAVSRSTQALRAFLMDKHSLSDPDAQELLAHLSDDAGYVQAVTILSAIRTALGSLEAGPLRALCLPPFLNVGQLLRERGLLLVPMTDTDFPRHDRLLSAMLDLTLNRILATRRHSSLSLHLHDPHLYRDDHGQRWIEVARRDPHLSLLLDIQQPDRNTPREGGEVVFRCSDAFASFLIDDWHLPASTSDLTELPAGTGIARLPGMVVTLKVSNQ